MLDIVAHEDNNRRFWQLRNRKRRKVDRRFTNWYPPCSCLTHFHTKYGMRMHMFLIHGVKKIR